MPIQSPPIENHEKQFLHWGGLRGSSLALAITTAALENYRPIILIVPDNLTANQCEEEIRFFCAGHANPPPLISFPDWEILPYDQFSPHQDIISDRLQALSKIPLLARGIVIVALSTLMHR